MLPLIDGKEPWAEDRGGGLCKSSNGEGHDPVDGDGDGKGDDISRSTWKDDKHSTSVLSSNGADDVSTRDIVRQGQLTPAPASTSSASSSSSPSSSRVQNISTIHRRSFYEKHENYALIFIPELCHAADKLRIIQSAVRKNVCFVNYDSNTSLADLIRAARFKLEVSGEDGGEPPGLDCIGFVCLDNDDVITDATRAFLDPVDDPDKIHFWQSVGLLLRSGTGRQLHVFTNMCDALPQSGIGDIERKQRLACSSIRACDMNTMVTPNAKGVTARYHSTAGLYFYESGLVNWVSSLRATRVALKMSANGARASHARRLGLLWADISRVFSLRKKHEGASCGPKRSSSDR